jgi:transposase
MAGHLSSALRELIIAWYYEDHVTALNIARRARCDISTIYKVIRRFRLTGNPHALPQGHPRYLINEQDIRYVLALLQANPALFLDELQLRLYTDRYLWVSISTISRALAQHGYSYKKLAKQAAERNAFLRACWLAQYGDIPAECCIWLDKSGVSDRDHFCANGWSPIGIAPVRSESFARDIRLTMIPALTVDGIIGMDIFDGGVGKPEFLQFLRQQLVRALVHYMVIHKLILIIYQVPQLNPYLPDNPLPRSVVILDNCAIHHDEDVRALIEGMGGMSHCNLPNQLACFTHFFCSLYPRCKAHLPSTVLARLQSHRASLFLDQGMASPF